MNSKKNWIRIVKITAVLLPAVLMILFMPVNDFSDAPRIRDFYLEEPNSLDVVVMGSSEDYAGYSPVLAYEEYGFTSYLYVLSANAFSLFPAQLEEVLSVQSPSMIIVDIGEMIRPKEDTVDTVLRQFLAGIPFSWHKVKLIEQYGDTEDLLSYYFPFIVNHGKADGKTMWEYIKTNNAIHSRGYSLLKGAISFTGSGENWDGPYVEPINTTGDLSTTELPENVIKECKLVLDACAEHPEVEFVFINYPHRITTEDRYRDYQLTNAAGEMIESYGYDFINLESMLDNIGLVPETDFYNNHHMNLYGQYKTTRFLCDLLVTEYGIAIREQSAQNRSNWEDCVQYQHLYYQMFDELFHSREPWEFGYWMQEEAWLFEQLEARKAAEATPAAVR